MPPQFNKQPNSRYTPASRSAHPPVGNVLVGSSSSGQQERPKTPLSRDYRKYSNIDALDSLEGEETEPIPDSPETKRAIAHLHLLATQENNKRLAPLHSLAASHGSDSPEYAQAYREYEAWKDAKEQRERRERERYEGKRERVYRAREEAGRR
ncbi:hypothetical protein JCM8547_001148 [Rhodosporidiobolus lusitaniae]